MDRLLIPFLMLLSAGGGDDVHEMRDEEEHLFNEELNYERMGQSRSHLDDSEYRLFGEEDDMPASENPARWTSIGLENFAGFGVNSAKKKMWERCNSELNDVGEQCRKVFGTGARRVNQEDIVKYMYGVDSHIWYVFRERLGWNLCGYIYDAWSIPTYWNVAKEESPCMVLKPSQCTQI